MVNKKLIIVVKNGNKNVITMINKNVGIYDRLVRVMIGLLFFIGLIYFYQSEILLAGLFGLLSIIMVLTAFLGRCPIYCATNISTNK